MAKKNALNAITTVAQELYDLETRISKFEEAFKPLKEQRDELRGELLSALKQSHLKSVKVESGEMFVRLQKINYEIVDEDKANAWAKKNNCLRIDKIAANQLLHKAIETPDGFDRVQKEYLSVKKPLHVLE